MTTTMDVKQLQETSRQISKAFDGGDPSSTLLALLSPLEKWKATEDSLRQSKIGIVVGKLRSSKDPKVASLATQLVHRWKAEVNKKKSAAGGGTPGKGVNGDIGSGRNSPAPKKEVAAPKKFSVAPDKRNVKADGVDTAVTKDSARDGCITLIYNGLAFMSEEAPSDILSVSRAIELAAYEAHGSETSGTYKQKMRSLHLNLKMKQNSTLRRDVFNGSIDPKRFASMTSEELKSEDQRRKDAELEKENMSKAMTAQEEKAVSTTYVPSQNPQDVIALQEGAHWIQKQDLILYHRLARQSSWLLVVWWSMGSSLRSVQFPPSPTASLLAALALTVY